MVISLPKPSTHCMSTPPLRNFGEPCTKAPRANEEGNDLFEASQSNAQKSNPTTARA